MPEADDWFVVVNPASGGGRAGRRWPALGRALSSAGVRFRHCVTSHPGHATSLVRDAVLAGYRRVLAVGGDGVLHEALNGLMAQDSVPASAICLGAAPLGSGNDWARGRCIPPDPAHTARCVATGRTVMQDVGVLEFADAPPGARTCYFINVAGAGIDADVLRRLPARVPRRLAYVVGLLRSLAAFPPARFDLLADGKREQRTLLVALLALGPYCGGGMRPAPAADPADGLLDLVTVEPLRLPWELARLTRLFDGRLTGERFAALKRVTSVAITAAPKVAVQADGQLVGQTPVTATLLPGALRTLAC